MKGVLDYELIIKRLKFKLVAPKGPIVEALTPNEFSLERGISTELNLTDYL